MELHGFQRVFICGICAIFENQRFERSVTKIFPDHGRERKDVMKKL